MIKNHYSAKLSDIDLKMIKEVPPGGNWKDIPLSIPSKRLEQIRESFKKGEGSRSTYYGRLESNNPSYTITTYFNRPGNGCHIHYDFAGGQHRLISQREAARLQSFPDSFVFYGSKNSINKQIGNAVPPLLAYQVAKHIDKPSMFLDLFCGAGGLSLGFILNGWTPVIANDIDPDFVKTYSKNVHDNVICGDIKDKEIQQLIVEEVKKARRLHPTKKLYILGGPPCQGFSTAGMRSSDDERNLLFRNYKEIVDQIQPDGFVFENVMGILNMQSGKVFAEIKTALESVTDQLSIWKLNAEEYGVPQRRRRVMLIGKREIFQQILPPPTVCSPLINKKVVESKLHKPINVKEALSDLPEITSNEDGSEKDYISEAKTDYQKLMRGNLTPDQFLKLIS